MRQELLIPVLIKRLRKVQDMVRPILMPGRTGTLSRNRNTFRGVPKAELERRTNAFLQAMTVSFEKT